MKNRQLPIFSIEGTDFYVDVEKRALVLISDPEKTISFVEHMQFREDYYLLLYDREERSYKDAISDPDQVLEVDVPQLVVLDPEGMAAKYGLKLAEIKGMTDRELMIRPFSERQLPFHEIAGTTFLVDVEKGELVQANDPGNIIWFSELNDKGDHYEMLYDLRDKNWVTPVGPMDDQMIKVQIPLMTALDPEGMALKYGDPEVYLQGRTEQQYLESLALLADRYRGELPRISIGIDTFIVDVARHELQHEEYPDVKIDLEQMEFDNKAGIYQAYYNSDTMELVEINPKLTALPANVVMVQIPSEFRLDPVGMAKLQGLNEKEVLARYPIRRHLQAGIILLPNTNLPALIRRNLKRITPKNKLGY